MPRWAPRGRPRHLATATRVRGLSGAPTALRGPSCVAATRRMYGRLTPAARFWRKVDKSGECWEWRGALVRRGYGAFTVTAGVLLRAHRVAWVFTRGAIPPGKFICHRCDNPACVRPAHLFVGDALSNAQDRQRKGRSRAPRGENHGRAKLSWASVKAIRAEYERGRNRFQPGNRRMLAARYGIKPSVIRDVVNRKTWR